MTHKFTFKSLITLLSVLLTALMLPLLAHAEIYKIVDANGNVTYSNVKIKGAKKLDLEPADTSFGNDTNTDATRKQNACRRRVLQHQQAFPR